MEEQKSYEATCELLQEYGLLEEGSVPPIPSHTPRFDDKKPLGVSFFRECIEDGELDRLYLPRTFIGRSEIRNVSFENTNLMESRLCWNDFIDVNFTQANLQGGDLRASLFQNVVFTRANLSGADLRHSDFDMCNFSDANMSNAKLAQLQVAQMSLSSHQIDEIDWQAEDGPEPEGG